MIDRRRTLEALLRKHVPADAAEAAFRQAMLELVQAAADPFARDAYEPGHFTASAFLLAPGAEALLLIHHEKLQRWLQPGGHVDPTDIDIMAAARREVREEAGLSDVRPHVWAPGIFDVDIHTIPARRDEPQHQHFDVRFLLQATSTTVTAGSDAEAVRWVAIDDVSEVESDASVMRAVRKLRALIGR